MPVLAHLAVISASVLHPGHAVSGHVPVPGAIVTISNRSFVESVTAGKDGRFAFVHVRPGEYELRVTAPGYAVYETAVMLPRNRLDVKNLVPADRQTVSVAELASRTD